MKGDADTLASIITVNNNGDTNAWTLICKQLQTKRTTLFSLIMNGGPQNL